MPEILALLNSAILALLDGQHVTNVAAARRQLAACQREALRLILEGL